ncbi:hypothetical protein pdam_00007868 [Pocillopora damicornis]|uniref:Malate dehydrogenase n=1 Tax=Pocillopora damicornis TaxID=46731 RepID=A0A3M6T8B2_POCDA|nr:hypothetical protein pdam_00007868 [Pocillopora damicornis]
MAGLVGRTVCSRRLVGKIRYLHTSRKHFDQYKCVAVNEVESFVERCMSAVGTPLEHCKALAQVLVAGDARGHFSHGLNRLEMYVHDINVGSTVINGDPEIVRETSATALVEGNNLLGPVVGNFCNDLAMKKAQETGIGWVACKGSNHYGIAGWYTIKAVEKGLIGMSFTNTSPLVVPTRARQVTLGTNPLSVAAPAKNGDSFVLDMATSAVALGKIEMADRKGVEIPHGWAVDSKGLGQCFVAVDPKAFSEGFEDRMQSLMDHCRNLQPAEGETTVLVAGDPERAHIQKVKEDGGIHYHVNLLEAMDKLADQLGVPCMPTK